MVGAASGDLVPVAGRFAGDAVVAGVDAVFAAFGAEGTMIGFGVTARVVSGLGVEVAATVGSVAAVAAGVSDAAVSAGASVPMEAVVQIDGSVFLSISNSMTFRRGFAGVVGKVIGFPLIESFTTAASDRE